MRVVCAFLFCLCELNAISLKEVVELAINNSRTLEGHRYTVSSASYHTKSELFRFLPSASVGYSIRDEGGYSVSAAFNATLKYDFFNGLRDYYGVQKNVVSREIAENDLDAARNDVALRTKIAYIKTLEYKESLKIAQDSIRLLELQLDQAKQFFEQGMSDRSAVLSVEVSLANARIEMSQIKVSLDYSLHTLSKLSGHKLSLNSLEDVSMDDEKIFNKHKLLSIVYNDNPKFKSMVLKKQQNAFDIKINNSSHMPSVNFSYSLFYRLGSGAGFRSELTLVWSLSNIYKNYFSAESKRLDGLAIGARLLDLREDTEVQMAKLLNDLEVARKRCSQAEAAVVHAQENYRIASNKYQQHLSSYLELLNAELMLKNAKSKLVNHRYEVVISIAHIDHLQNKHF